MSGTRYGESVVVCVFFFFSSRRRHTRSLCDWSSDVCSSDLVNSICGSCGSWCLHETRISNAIEIKLTSVTLMREKNDDYIVQSS